MNERVEILARIGVAIVSGFVLGLWKTLITFVAFFHWIATLVTGRRNEALATFCETWNTQNYVLTRYLLLVDNQRPFPFSSVRENLSKFEA